MDADTDHPAPDRDPQEASTRHQGLVTLLKYGGYLADPRVEDAFRAVPRHLFLPEVPVELVYADEAIPTKRQDGLVVSSSSQPTVMAIMLDQLGLEPGDRVLEIGAGTGYNAALMARIVGEQGSVLTMDIDEDIVLAARAHLAQAGATGVTVVHGDGARGYPDAAPYDRIILTVGTWDISPAWIAQLRQGGRFLAPLVVQGPIQKLALFERSGDVLKGVSVRDGSFMPLRGIDAGPRFEVALGPEPGLVLDLGRPRALDPAALHAALTGPYTDIPVTVQAHSDELWRGFSLWLATHEPAMCSLAALGSASALRAVPPLFSSPSHFRSTLGLQAGTSLSLLARPEREPSSSSALIVRRFGQDERLVQRLRDQLAAWDTAGRPTTQAMRITAYPRDARVMPTAQETLIERQHVRLVLTWS